MKIIKKENMRISINANDSYIELSEIAKDNEPVWGMQITIQTKKWHDKELNEWEISHASHKYADYKEAEKYIVLLNLAIEIVKNKKV